VKQVEVTILGQGYILGCPEGGETLLHSAVASVDQEMSAIRDGNKVKARERIAVLAALNLAYRLAEHLAVAPTVAPAAHSGPNTAESLDASEVDLDSLVQRIDAVLGDDDHLL
jgi:cell division protein ZapA